MQKHKNIDTETEKPTAREYYSKLLDETKIDATWNLVKFKIRHLKLSFEKAEAIRMSSRTEDDMESQKSLEDQIRRLCPHYKQLSDIFSEESKIETVVRERQFSCSDDSLLSFVKEESQVEEFMYEEPQRTSDYVSDPSPLEKAMALDTTDPLSSHILAKIKQPVVETFLAKLLAMNTKKNKFEEDRLSLEKEKFVWTKDIEERKLKLKEKRLNMEYQMRQMELKQRERLLNLELQCKYGNKNATYK